MAVKHIGSDLTVSWNGTDFISADVAVRRSLKRLPSCSPFVLSPEADYVAATDSHAEAGEPRAEPMEITLWIQHKVSTTSALVAERELMDEIRLIQETINPFDGVGTLKFARADADENAIATEVYKVRPVSVPRYSVEWIPSGDPPTVSKVAVAETEWRFWCPIPYFYNATATTLEYVADDPADSDTMANPGIAPCGARFAVTAISGSPTQVTITNSTNGYAFVWKKTSGNFAAGDWIDWYYTDPREQSHDTDTSIVDATGAAYFELACGNNTVTALRSAGSGTVTITASWKPRYLSL